MRSAVTVVASAVVLAAMAFFPVRADDNYLKNADLSSGVAGWHGEVSIAYLKADGSEGVEGAPGDTSVTRVLKIPLTRSGDHEAYQEFDAPDHPSQILYSVEVCSSLDFQPSSSESDYMPELLGAKPGGIISTYLVGACRADFWFRAGPYGDNWAYRLSKALVPGRWTTLSADFRADKNVTTHSLVLCVPPGAGAVYVRNPSAVHSERR